MYRLMVVDDDLYARVQLKTSYALEQAGYYVAMEATNGVEALQLLAQETPDIILEDMNMPEMDGVTLINQVRYQYPWIPVLALSGYDDFAYVRASLRLGAVDYLLKHASNRETLLEALGKCVDVIQREKNQSMRIQEESEQMQLGQQAKRREALLKLLRGDILGEPSHMLLKAGLHLGLHNLQLISMQLDNIRALTQQRGKIELEMLRSVIVSLGQDVINRCNSGVMEYIGGGEFIIVLSFEDIYSQLYVSDMCIRIVDALRQNLEKYTSLTACFVIGKVARNLADVPVRYQQMQKSMEMRHLSGNDKLIYDTAQLSPSQLLTTLETEEEQTIASAVREGNRSLCLAKIAGVYDRLTLSKANQASCQIISMELLNLLNRFMRTLPLGQEIYDDNERIKEELMICETMQHACDCVARAYTALFELLQEMGPVDTYNHNTLGAIKYIHEHYTENIRLEDAAAHLNVNKSYLCRVFGQDCGKSFTEYLTFYRVKTAQRLMAEGGQTIREVAEAVGYANHAYFFRVFKAMTGMTPKSYGREAGG